MAIDNPQAVRFANESGRTLANTGGEYYYAAKLFLNEWSAADIASVMPNDEGETIVDGSATDGRTPISGLSINQLKGHVQEMVDGLEANDFFKLKILLAIATRIRVREG